MSISPETMDAALEQLDWAARLFSEHQAYRAATTLASAADELLGKPLAEVSAFHLLRAGIADPRGMDRDAVGIMLNAPKNWLKHGTNPPERPDWQHFAAQAILRAATNYAAANRALPPSVLHVLEWADSLPADD